MATVTHKVKCWSNYYDAIAAGDKKFDVRRDDRGYQKGDVLLLQKFDGQKLRYVCSSYGEPYSIEKKIKYILTGGQFGIEPGYVVLGF